MVVGRMVSFPCSVLKLSDNLTNASTGSRARQALRPLAPPATRQSRRADRGAAQRRYPRRPAGARRAAADRAGADRALGVSRTVVREAVAALRADGLVVTRRGSGAYVADPSASAVPHRRPRTGRAERRPRRDGTAACGRGRGGGACRRTRLAPPDRRRSAPRGAPSIGAEVAARAPSPRTSPSIAPSPRRPATRSSRAFWPFLAVMSFRARACGSRLTRRPNGAPISSASSTSTPALSPAFPAGIPAKRAAPCANISRARSSAIAT